MSCQSLANESSAGTAPCCAGEEQAAPFAQRGGQQPRAQPVPGGLRCHARQQLQAAERWQLACGCSAASTPVRHHLSTSSVIHGSKKKVWSRQMSLLPRPDSSHIILPQCTDLGFAAQPRVFRVLRSFQYRELVHLCRTPGHSTTCRQWRVMVHPSTAKHQKAGGYTAPCSAAPLVPENVHSARVNALVTPKCGAATVQELWRLPNRS